ncbi:thiosulfate sulfurtransferase GlpE [Methyloterricola oryzae]|uniref:thiosulfate sulfurtransferase GlpE n=1 Tax=Methyloterricola oryzae TaxID=1495050 RepID=UPI0005EB5403|nr:thiosulfate sulfurtransferase GlpE [Methyloterricola oryzae]
MNPSSAWRRVSAKDLRELLQRPHLRVLDMRDEASFAQGHIAGAEYLSNGNLETVLLKTPRHVPVLIYCYHGNASQSGAKLFVDFGFQEVYDLVGGYESWRLNEARIDTASD